MIGSYNLPEKAFFKRIAVVIPIFSVPGHKEEVGGRYRGGEKKETETSFFEDKLELIKFSLAAHKHYNPGVPYQMIFVDNSSPDREINELIVSFCNKNDALYVKRPNTGFSFGAYKYAWETFGDQFEYYLFHEQDIAPIKDNWLLDILAKFFEYPGTGAVGNLCEPMTGYRGRAYFEQWGIFHPGMVGEYWNNPEFRQCNLDGMFMFTSSKILKECGLQITEMKLTDPNNPESWDITPGVNELFWQHYILMAGYKIVSFHDNLHLFTHGICYLDFEDTLRDRQLPPMMHAQTFFVNREMRLNYFKWYEEFCTQWWLREPLTPGAVSGKEKV